MKPWIIPHLLCLCTEYVIAQTVPTDLPRGDRHKPPTPIDQALQVNKLLDSHGEPLVWGRHSERELNKLHYSRVKTSLPAGWLEEMGYAEVVDGSSTLPATPLSTTLPISTVTVSTTVSQEETSDSTVPNHGAAPIYSPFNTAADGFEFAADRLDTRRASYAGVNGLNRPLTGAWTDYWTDHRDVTVVKSNFLEWANKVARLEVDWLRSEYTDELAARKAVNSDPSLLQPKDKARQVHRGRPMAMRYKNKVFPPEVVHKAFYGGSAETFSHLFGEKSKRMQDIVNQQKRKLNSPDVDDGSDDELPPLVIEFTPPAWEGTTKSDRMIERDVDVYPSRPYDAARIVEAAGVDQILEPVVAPGQAPFHGLMSSDRGYSGKDVALQRPVIRPWNRFWRPKKVYDTWHDDVPLEYF